MRLRPRLTVQSLMVLVAIVAGAVGAEMMRRRWVYCRDQAARCASWEERSLHVAELYDGDVTKHRRNIARLRKENSGIDHFLTESRKTPKIKTYEHDYLIGSIEINRSAIQGDEALLRSAEMHARMFRERAAEYVVIINKYKYLIWHPWIAVSLEPVDSPP